MSARFLAGGDLVGRYRIEGLLGRGGMATVYVAREEPGGRTVALKLLAPALGADDAFVERFRREGRLQASLEHPHAVTVLEAGESEHGAFLAMQRVSGPTLAALIADGALTPKRALDLLGQVAQALDAAHAAGLVHRDVKPRNVLVGEGDHAYLADFGLTRLGDEAGPTATGAIVGTLAYLAPEIILGEPASPASDRYAFAAMAWECLTGSVVFPRPTEAAQLYAHTTDPVPQISARRTDLPPALDDVLARALAKRPQDRPASATDLVAELRRALGEEALPPPQPRRAAALHDAPTATTPVAAPAPVGAGTPSPWGRGRATALIAAALAGAAVAAGLVLALDGDDGVGRPDTAAPPVPLPGMTVLGSSLTSAGVPRACDGRAVSVRSEGCTISQAALPGHTIVVPRNGVVRRWAVRDAVGELRLAAVRTRDGKSFQLALSDSAFVADRRVHAFRTDLEVEAGDILALHVVSGSAVGMRRSAGATTNRWFPRLRGLKRPVDRGPGTGADREVLLRVEYLPGGTQRLPAQVTGKAAAGLPARRVVARRVITVPSGRRVELRIVARGGLYALERVGGGRREASIALPGFAAGVGDVVTFEAYTEPDKPDDVDVYLEYQRTDSVRRSSHYLVARSGEFIFYD